MEVLKKFPDLEYIGYDISQEIIDINKKRISLVFIFYLFWNL